MSTYAWLKIVFNLCIEFIMRKLASCSSYTHVCILKGINFEGQGRHRRKVGRRPTVLNLNEVPTTFNDMKDENRCFLQSRACTKPWPFPAPSRFPLEMNSRRCVSACNSSYSFDICRMA